MRRMRRAWAGLALLCAIATALAAGPIRVAYRSVTLHASLDAAASLVAILAAYLVFGRLRRRPRVNGALFAAAFGLLALAGLIFAVITAVDGTRPVPASWLGRIASGLGALLLAAAALAPRTPLRRFGHATTLALSIVLAGAAVSLVIVVAAGSALPAGVRVIGTGGGTWPDIDVSPAIIVRHILNAVLFAIASVGFLRRAERHDDEFYWWVSFSAMLLAFAELNYTILPSRFTNWVFIADAFRLMGYAVLFAGAMQEIRSYWASLTREAIMHERSRIARDLHDGVAQEIAYIQRNLASLERPDGDSSARIARLRQAAERAQVESRKALAALTTPVEEPLEHVLERAASEVASRFGAELELDLVPDARIDPEQAESVLRIACEAVANAARHSGARRIALTLDRPGGRLSLRVRDWGHGFDPTVSTGGFGLISMRERARAIGAELRIESEPGRGTVVELAL